MSVQEMTTLSTSPAHASSAPLSAGSLGSPQLKKSLFVPAPKWSHLFDCINAFIMALVT